MTDGEVIVVVPPGSRIATSRINFKLLAQGGQRAAAEHRRGQRRAAVRALAISAGLPTYDSLAAAEQALAKFREQDRRLAERISDTPGEGLSEEDAEALRAARPPLWSSTRSSDTSVMPTPIVRHARPLSRASSRALSRPPTPCATRRSPRAARDGRDR